MTRAELLARLEAPDARAQLVERLRSAAELLEGGSPVTDAAMRTVLAFRQAFHLRELASALCDHARTSADGTCRYCETRITEAKP